MDVLAGGGEWILTGGEMAGRVSTRDVGGGRREGPHQPSQSSSFLSDRVIHEGLIPAHLCVWTQKYSLPR